jgi:hypothetical protein
MLLLFNSIWQALICFRLWVGGGSGRYLELALDHVQCCVYLSLFDAIYYVVGSELEEAAAAILNQQQSTLNAATSLMHSIVTCRLWVGGGSGRHLESATVHAQCRPWSTGSPVCWKVQSRSIRTPFQIFSRMFESDIKLECMSSYYNNTEWHFYHEKFVKIVAGVQYERKCVTIRYI